MKKIIDMLKSMTNSKKKVFALALSVCIVVLSIAGSSIAYFTDTDDYQNTFTSGKVDIALLVEGTAVAADAFVDSDKVYPGYTITTKTTAIDNVGTEDAYVGAIITLYGADLYTIVDATTTAGKKVAIGSILTNLPGENVTITTDLVDGKPAYVIYIIYKNALTKDATPAAVFENIAIPTVWDNEEVAIFEGVKLDVKAYAVQTSGMDGTALDALKLGFPGVFDKATQTVTP